jgi:hypothetical protein
MDRDLLRVPDRQGQLPLHLAVIRPAVDTMIIQRMLWLYPEALCRRDSIGATPMSLAFDRPNPQIPVPLLTRMVNMAPDSIRTLICEFQTPLLDACHFIPDVNLTALLIDAWPIALCLRGRSRWIREWCLPLEAVSQGNGVNSPELKNLVDRETKEIFLAFVEFVMHETAHRVPSPIKEHLESAIRRTLPVTLDLHHQASSFAIAQSIRSSLDYPIELCTSVLCEETTQTWLREEEQLRDLVCGLYRMNKVVGRAHGYGQGGSSASRELDILQCVTDNLDCIFLHLRECVCLFTGDRG